MNPSKTGATPRQLNERELHRELRRADFIIDDAMGLLSPADRRSLNAQQAILGITDPLDPRGKKSRKAALNRIKPKPDYNKIMLIALCILLGWAWYTAQQDRDLFMQPIAIGVKHGE